MKKGLFLLGAGLVIGSILDVVPGDELLLVPAGIVMMGEALGGKRGK